MAEEYSIFADRLKEGELRVDESITKATEAIASTMAFEPVEKPIFQIEKNKEDASHEKRWRKKLIASSLSGSERGPRAREQLTNSCSVLGEEVRAFTRSPAKGPKWTALCVPAAASFVLLPFRITRWLSSRNNTDN
jgi:hypothetical protein